MGSTDRLTDSFAIETDAYTYQAFGVLNSASGSSVNPYRFVGRLGYYRDTDNNLLLIRARHYDPMRQRFLTQDPILFIANEMNLYRYVANVPTGFVDPGGLFVFPPFGQLPTKPQTGIATCSPDTTGPNEVKLMQLFIINKNTVFAIYCYHGKYFFGVVYELNNQGNIIPSIFGKCRYEPALNYYSMCIGKNGKPKMLWINIKVDPEAKPDPRPAILKDLQKAQNALKKKDCVSVMAELNKLLEKYKDVLVLDKRTDYFLPPEAGEITWPTDDMKPDLPPVPVDK